MIPSPRTVYPCHGSRLAAVWAALALIGLMGFARVSAARTLEVGPGRDLKAPSEAAAIARPGDSVIIDSGEYFDCAVWTVDHLTIEGRGSGAVITDKTCEGKALFVTRGNDILIRNLTFTRARVPDHNGAGIRAEGRNLRIEQNRFINNEEGLLAGDRSDSTIQIANSEFLRNGKCDDSCAHGVYVGKIALLRIEHSRFVETRVGHHVKSRAMRTELVDNEIMDGQEGTASYLVDIPNGGSLLMKGNRLEKGPNNSNHSAAIVIGAEGVTQRTAEISISGNTFVNDDTNSTVFVKNLTATEAMLRDNSLRGKVVPLSGDGTVH